MSSGQRVWRDRGRLLAPDPALPFVARAVKDPSIVHHDGAWHLFYTAIGAQGACTLGYLRAPHLDTLGQQPPHRLAFDAATQPAAPFVFHHAAHGLWYLIFQVSSPQGLSHVPVYATNRSLDPAMWSAPRSLLPAAADPEQRRIDFWSIADRTHHYLFYWDNAGGTWCFTCPRARFPHGFATDWRVFSVVAPAWEIHEAGCVYWVRDQGLYLMLVESCRADSSAAQRAFPDARQYRFYTAFTARRLRGPWYLVHDPSFARPEDVATEGAARWMHNISHGEVIRRNTGATPTITSTRVRFLIQAQTEPFVPAAAFAYNRLHWELGLIELERLPDLQGALRPELQVAP